MSGSWGRVAGVPRRAKPAALSRHWKAAVLAAAGLVTMTGTTAVAGMADAEAAGVKPASTARDDTAETGRGGGDEGKEKPTASKGDEGKERDRHKGEEGGGEEHRHGYGHGDEGYGHKKRHEDHGGGKRYVGCDPADLVAAFVDLNESRGGTLVLAKDCTYTLTTSQDGNGLPEIVQPVTVHGNGSTIARAANADRFRIFEVGAGGDLRLRDLTLTRGEAEFEQDGGAIRVSPAGRLDLGHVDVKSNKTADDDNDEGGGLFNAGVARVRDSSFSRNWATFASAIGNHGKLEIADSRITRNASEGFAAILNEEGATVAIRGSLLSHNTSGDGGALHNHGVAELDKSALTYNFASLHGGAIDTDGGPLYLRDSVVKGNVAVESGGGITTDQPSFVVEGSTIADNAVTAEDGAGGGIYLLSPPGVAIRDSKITGNQAPGNGARGGGIFVDSNDFELSPLALTDSTVKDNLSDEPAGGIHNRGEVTAHGKVRIIDNVPTNCEGSENAVPGCFG
ncbi:right-handed parallel beta-helix repeat-containing protein [Streptomyces sp. NPDC059828]|uniref:right-handed parallel beta-helix repeat-containing protein n=1 Tax=Streptomyces sp. NPDC059828 TaxID=3346965 RepID=UPI00364A78E5